VLTDETDWPGGRYLVRPSAVPGRNILNGLPRGQLTFGSSYWREDREIAVLTWVVGSG